MVHDSDKNRLAGADDIMLGFQNLSISSVDPPKHIISNVSGFVVKGVYMREPFYEKILGGGNRTQLIDVIP